MIFLQETSGPSSSLLATLHRQGEVDGNLGNRELWPAPTGEISFKVCFELTRISHTLLLCGGQVLCWQRQPSPIDPQGLTMH